jgi:hypothetical protein
VAVGSLVWADAAYAVALPLASGGSLTLSLKAPAPLAPPALHVLNLWVQSAHLAVARWVPLA